MMPTCSATLPEAFARHMLEIDALVAVLGRDDMREGDSVELLGHRAVVVDKGLADHQAPAIREALGVVAEAIAIEPRPGEDLMRFSSAGTELPNARAQAVAKESAI